MNYSLYMLDKLSEPVWVKSGNCFFPKEGEQKPKGKQSHLVILLVKMPVRNSMAAIWDSLISVFQDARVFFWEIMGRFQIPQPINIQVGQVGPALKITEKNKDGIHWKNHPNWHRTHRSFKWLFTPTLQITSPCDANTLPESNIAHEHPHFS